MNLKEESIRWSIKHLYRESDTDLFPRPFELEIIKEFEDELVAKLVHIQIGAYEWQASRRFIVPKDDVSYRVGTQLHMVDSIMLGAIIYEIGQTIETARAAGDIVFSYRFKPEPDGTMYANKKAWINFWKSCQEEIVDLDEIEDADDLDEYLNSEFKYVVSCDISDFYNQIYLHIIENQISACGLPNQVVKAINNWLTSVNKNSSRGVPIGPHASHLIAELSLIPVDQSLQLQGIPYKRYVDDFVFFCRSEKEARIRVQQFMEILDKNQRLVLQRDKTVIYTDVEFIRHTEKLLMQRPVYDSEHEILEIIQKYTDGNAYSKIKLSSIKDEHLRKLSKEYIVYLLEEYLKREDYSKLRWFYRRLSQIGIPHAVDFSIANFESILPALNDVCLYLNSCAENYQSDWKVIGEQLLDILDDEIIESNSFYQISLINLFVYNKGLNHIAALVSRFKQGNEDIKRKILLASMNYGCASWIYGLKEDQDRFSDWTRRAYIIATKALPSDQRKFLHGDIRTRLKTTDYLEHLILLWAKS